MVKNVYLYRHAQAEHNATSDWSIPDPPLTPLGRAQARAIPPLFKHTFPEALKDSLLVVSSPLRRTIQTTLIGFPSAEYGKPVLKPELQEINNLPCDTGSPPSTLAQLFPSLSLPISTLPTDWNSKLGPWSPTDSALAERARSFRVWLRAQEGEAAVVVAHGDFLRMWLAVGPSGDIEDHWENAEGRLYEWRDGHDSGDEHAWLIRRRERTAKVVEHMVGDLTSEEMMEEEPDIE